MSRSTDSNPVDRYASEVVAGRIPAGKYHRLACVRHLKDRAREHTPGFPFRFVWEERDEHGRLIQCAVRFLEFARKMKHYKGRQFAGKFFDPTQCQVFRLGSIFGWRHVDTGLRRFTTAYNEVPRKQGKSFEEAVVAVYATFFEGEPGAEGYCIATKEKQAKIAFDAAKRLVKSSGLTDRIKVNAANLNRETFAQKLEPLGSDSDTTDGLNPHFVGVDELHAFKVRGLLDVMESATGARLNPLNFQITTAGDDPVSPGGDQHDYACRILDGVLEDDPSTISFFVFIAHADEDDDPWAESTWIKANPHWGGSVNPEDMRKLAAKAQKMPSAAAEFKQKRLNLWVNTLAPSLSVEGWRKGQSAWEWEDLEHESCWVGIDLSSKIDLCSVSLVFPPAPGRPKWRLIQRIWTPEDTLKERAHKDRAPYDIWVQQGWLNTTPGTSIRQQIIREELKQLRQRFDIEVVGFDPWHADRLMEQMQDEDGWTEGQVMEVPQTFAALTSAESRFKAEVLAANIDARGCPVTGWAVSNVIDQTDGKGNILFSKKRSRGRIDPVKSATIGMSLYLRQPPIQEPEFQIMVVGR